MRILIVTPWFPTEDAPELGVFVSRDAAALSARHEVRVLHLDWTGEPTVASVEPEGVEVARLCLRRSRPWDFLRARRAVRAAAHEADVVHTHALPGLLPWLAGRPADRPWVHTEHWSAFAFPETLPSYVRPLAGLMARKLAAPDVVVAACTRLADAIRTRRPHGRIAIVPCVVPAAPITPRPASPFALLGVGGLIARKGPLVAVDTVAELRSRGHDATLAWVGGGPLEEAARTRASELGISSHVELAGRVAPDEVNAYWDRAAMLLLPTLGDNFCVAAAEALVHGRTLVSGAATGARDYAEPAVSRFVREQSADAYADAVESLAQAAGAISAFEVAATVTDRFSPETVCGLLESVYADAGAS